MGVVVLEEPELDRPEAAPSNRVRIGWTMGVHRPSTPGEPAVPGDRRGVDIHVDGHERGSLPVPGLLGLAGSAGFAVWTSLTCFVC